MQENKMRKQMIEGFISALKEDVIPWQRNWELTEAPKNPVSNVKYRGSNLLWLQFVSWKKGYNDPRWCTFNQANQNGWRIKKGEKGTLIEFYSLYDKQEKRNITYQEAAQLRKEMEIMDYYKRVTSVIKTHMVFNAAQIEGIPAREKKIAKFSAEQILRQRDVLLRNMDIKFEEGGDIASYSPGLDRIRMPFVEQFQDAYGYMATFLHEAGHATGHPKRLYRDLAYAKESSEYAKEEMCVEMASAFVAQELNTISATEEHIQGHKAYLQSWVQILENNPNELFHVINNAEKAADYLIEKGNFHSLEKELVEERQEEEKGISHESDKDKADVEILALHEWTGKGIETLSVSEPQPQEETLQPEADAAPEKTPEQAAPETPGHYYPIDEAAARRAKEAISFFDYKPGSATEEYRHYVDEAAELAAQQKKRVDPSFHEKIDSLLDTYARKLAANMNKGYEITARVPSIMISGGGNFPVRKKEKQNAAAGKNMQEFSEIQGLLDKIRSTGMGGISADDPAAVSKLESKLAKLEKAQETMKVVNAYYRKHKTLDGCPAISSEQAEKLKSEMASQWHIADKPYLTWELSNNNAEIRRVKKRIESLTKQKEAGYVGWEFDGGKVEASTVDNRLQIFFDGKPGPDIRADLKGNGFKWAPSVGAWQRQLNDNAIYAADRIKAIQPLTGESPTELQRRVRQEAQEQRQEAPRENEHLTKDISHESDKDKASVEILGLYKWQGKDDFVHFRQGEKEYLTDGMTILEDVDYQMVSLVDAFSSIEGINSKTFQDKLEIFHPELQFTEDQLHWIDKDTPKPKILGLYKWQGKDDFVHFRQGEKEYLTDGMTILEDVDYQIVNSVNAFSSIKGINSKTFQDKLEIFHPELQFTKDQLHWIDKDTYEGRQNTKHTINRTSLKRGGR